nr:unnamed protein product [Callosobruchus analis]
MVLMAIVDAKYRFLLADFGTNGRIYDGGVLQNTKFFEKLQNKTLKLPTTDDAFPLRVDMLKPYRQTDLNSRERKIFNYRLSRARSIVENAFGILASRFQIYHIAINVQSENIEKIVMSACVLHNFLIEHTPSSYAPGTALIKKILRTALSLPRAIILQIQIWKICNDDTKEIL